MERGRRGIKADIGALWPFGQLGIKRIKITTLVYEAALG